MTVHGAATAACAVVIGPIQDTGLVFAATPQAIVSADPVSLVMLGTRDGSVVAGELRALDTRTSGTLHATPTPKDHR